MGVVDAFAEIFYPALFINGVNLDEVGHLLHSAAIFSLLVGHPRQDHELRDEEDSLWCFSEPLAFLYLLLHLGDSFDEWLVGNCHLDAVELLKVVCEGDMYFLIVVPDRESVDG